MKVVILGAAGCFGQNLAIHLTNRGHLVTGFGRSISKPEPYHLGFKMDYRCYHLVDHFEQAWAEIEKINPDYIINFAAHAGLVPQSWTYPEAFYATNTLLPVKIAQRLFCRYIHIGSSEVYGSNNYAVTEEAKIRCSSPYAVSKAAADMHLLTLRDDRICIVRPSNCYCPGQALYRLIPRAVYAALTGKKMPLQGSPAKSYLHADDLSRAIEIIMQKQCRGVYNVGSRNPVGIQTVVEKVAEICDLGLEDVADVKPGRENEDQCYWIASEKMQKLGWKPLVSLEDGLKDMMEWGIKYVEKLSDMPLTYEFQR